MHAPSWRVLLLGGVSGTGKSTAAKTISRNRGIAWVQVDDLRLALERSLTTLPEGMKPLGFFHQADVWSLPAPALCDGLIRVGEVMSPAIEVVTENHDDQNDPAIIEGDGILPSLFSRSSVRERVATGRVKGVFLIEPDRDELCRNMLNRGRGYEQRTVAAQRREAEATWRFGQWLELEASRLGLPVVRPRPWDSLPDRLLEAVI